MVRGSNLQFPTNYRLKAKIWLAVACFILDMSDQEPPAALTPSIQMDRENLKDIFKSKGRGTNCLNWWKCKQMEPYAAGKRKKEMRWWQRREEMLRTKSNTNQRLKLEEKREGGAHEQASSEAQSTQWPFCAADLYPGKVSASPTGCLLRQTEKPWIQPCPTHPTKCRAIIYHHKRSSRLLPNEGCSL